MKNLFLFCWIISSVLLQDVLLRSNKGESLADLTDAINQARNQIKSGHCILVIVEKQHAAKTASEIAILNNHEIQKRTAEWKAHPNFGDPSVDEYFRKSIAVVPLTHQMDYGSWEETREEEWYFRILGEHRTQGDVDYAYRVDVKSLDSIDPMSLRALYLGWQNLKTQVFDGKNRTQLIRRTLGPHKKVSQVAMTGPNDSDFENIELWGRFPLLLSPHDGKLLGRKDMGGEELLLLQFHNPDDASSFVKLDVQPAKAFTLRSVAYYEQGNLVYEALYSDYKKSNDIWFPHLVDFVFYRPDDEQKKKFNDDIQREIHIKVKAAEFNIEIDSSIFHLTIPDSVMVMDFKSNPPVKTWRGLIIP